MCKFSADFDLTEKKNSSSMKIRFHPVNAENQISEMEKSKTGESQVCSQAISFTGYRGSAH